MDTLTSHTAQHPVPRRPGPGRRSLLEEVFGPVEAPAGTLARRLLQARSAIAYLGLVATLVQVVVWLMIALISTHLDSPWWLWTTIPAAVVVGGLSVVRRWHGWWHAEGSDQEEGR